LEEPELVSKQVDVSLPESGPSDTLLTTSPLVLPLPGTNTDPPTTSIHPHLLSPLQNYPPHPLFITEQLGVDRRLLLNRKRQLKMYRVWMQGKFRKIQQSVPPTS